MSQTETKYKKISGYVNRGSYEEEDKTTEDLILEICGWNEPVNCSSLIKLVDEIKPELSMRKNTLICTLIECISNHPLKMTSYTTLIGFLNKFDDDFGSDIIESLALSLQDAIDECNYNVASNIFTALCDLANVNAAHLTSIISLMKAFLTVAEDQTTPSIVSSWCIKTILYSVPFIGEICDTNKLYQESFEELFASIPVIIKSKITEYSRVFKVWNGDGHAFKETEYNEYLFKCLTSLRKKNWKTHAIYRPYEDAKDQLVNAISHKFTVVKLPSVYKCNKFDEPAHIFQLFENNECQSFKFCHSDLPMFHEFEYFYIHAYLSNILISIDSIRDKYFILRQLVESKNFNGPYLLIQCIINRLLSYHANNLENTCKYYHIVLKLVKLYETEFGEVIHQACNILFDHLERMNHNALRHFTNFMIFLCNNTSYNYPNWDMFNSPSLSLIQTRFITDFLRHLSYITDASKNEHLLSLLQLYGIPAKTDCYAYKTDEKQGYQLARLMVDHIRQNTPVDDVIKEFKNHEKQMLVSPIVQTILRGGHINPTHTEKSITKYIEVIKYLVDSKTKFECIKSICDFWARDIFRALHVLQLLYDHSVITIKDTVTFVMNQTDHDDDVVWFIIHYYVNMVLARLQSSAKVYRETKKQYKSMSSLLDDSDKKTQVSENLQEYRKSKKQVQTEYFDLLHTIIQCVSKKRQETKSKSEDGLMKRLQQLLLKTFKNVSNVTKFGISRYETDELIKEVIKQFVSLYS